MLQHFSSSCTQIEVNECLNISFLLSALSYNSNSALCSDEEVLIDKGLSTKEWWYLGFQNYCLSQRQIVNLSAVAYCTTAAQMLLSFLCEASPPLKSTNGILARERSPRQLAASEFNSSCLGRQKKAACLVICHLMWRVSFSIIKATFYISVQLCSKKKATWPSLFITETLNLPSFFKIKTIVLKIIIL